MPIRTATNKETGERVALVNGSWQPIEKSATGPEGQKAYLIGGSWLVDSTVAQPKPTPIQQPPEEGTSLKDFASATVAGMGKILPTTVKGLADITSMVTQGEYGKDTSQAMTDLMGSVEDYYHTENVAKQNAKFNEIWTDKEQGWGDAIGFMLTHPALMVEKGVETVGSMVLPVGVAGAVGKAGTALKASDKALKTAVNTTAIGTTAVQNAADTFNSAELKGATLEDKYNAAAVSAAATVLMGIVTGGGAESAVAKKLLGQLESGKIGVGAVVNFIKSTLNTAAKEGVQETGEEAGSVLGEIVGGGTPTPESIPKRLAVSGLMGSVVGGTAGMIARPETVAATEDEDTTLTPEEAAREEEIARIANTYTQMGVAPDDARAMAIAKISAATPPTAKEAPSAAQKAQPAEVAGKPVGVGTGVSPTVPVPPTTPTAPGLTEAPERSGMVRAGETAGEDSGATGAKPTPLTEQTTLDLRTLEEKEQAEQDAIDDYNFATAKVAIANGVLSPTLADIQEQLELTPPQARRVFDRLIGAGLATPAPRPSNVPPPAPLTEQTALDLSATEQAPAPVETVTPTSVEPTTPAPTFPVDDQQYTDLVARLRSSEDPLKPTIPLIQNAIGGKKPQDARDVLARMEQDGVVEKRKNGSYKVIKPTEKPVAPEAPAVEEPAPTPEEPVAAEPPAVEEPVASEAPTPAPVEEPVAAEAPTPAPVEEPVAAEAPTPAAEAPAPAPVAAAPTPAADLYKKRDRLQSIRNSLLEGEGQDFTEYAEWVASGAPSVPEAPPAAEAPPTPEGRKGLSSVTEGTEVLQSNERSQLEVDLAVDIAEQKVAASRQAEEMAQGVGLLQSLRNPRLIWPEIRRKWKSLNDAQRRAILSVSTTDFLAYGGGEQVPELRNTNTLLQKMAGLTEQLLSGGTEIVSAVHKAFTADPKLRPKLENLVLEATLTEIDPADPNFKVKSEKLTNKYNALGAKGQKLYVMLRDYYETMSDYYGKLLDDQIAALSISPESKQAIMLRIRKMYEADKRIRPYFPLVRKGDYWLRVGKGPDRQFFMFETMEDRDRVAEEEARKRYPKMSGPEAVKKLLEDTTDFNIGNDVASLRQASMQAENGIDPSSLLRDIFAAIDNAGDPSVGTKESIKNDIYEMYLQTLPEQSFRKQFMHREGVAGFRLDLVRNTAQTSTKMAHQLARLKYSPLLRNSLEQARASISGQPELEPFVDEMAKRVQSELAPPQNDMGMKVANVVNRMSFIWYMSSWASALVQPLSVFTTGLPVLASNHGPKAAAQLAKNMAFWNTLGVVKTNVDGSKSLSVSIQSAKNLSSVQKRAIQEMMFRKVAQTTYATEVYGFSKVSTDEYGSAGSKLKRGTDLLIGGLMHSTERLSREIVFLTSFDLNYDKFKGPKKPGQPDFDQKAFDAAVDQAVLDTTEALNDYSSHNRPLVMKGTAGRIALQFKMYPLHMTLYLLKNFKAMLPGLNKEGKKEAATKFFGTLGMTFLVAGAQGLPLMSVVLGAISAAWKQMGDDDDELPDDMRNVNYGTWWKTTYIPKELGAVTVGGYTITSLDDLLLRGVLNKLTGADIAGRAGLNDMYLREGKELPTARAEFMELAMQLAGPAPAMVLSWADAFDAWALGDYTKAVEKLSPAILRSLVTVQKYQTEGFKSPNGKEVIAPDSFRMGELIVQGIGFRPDVVANLQNRAFQLFAVDQAVKNERTKILRRLAIAYDKSEEDFSNTLEEAIEFNRKFPSNGITGQVINSSIGKKLKARANTVAGVTLTKNNVMMLNDAVVELERIVREHEENQ